MKSEQAATVASLPLTRGSQQAPPKNPNGPKATVKPPTAPRDLSPDAKKKFRSVVKTMIEAGTYKATDIDHIALYAETWLTWRTATDEIRKTAGIHIAGNGRVTRSPYIPIAEKASVALRQMAKELGLTPASRGRIAKEKQKKKSDWDAI